MKRYLPLPLLAAVLVVAGLACDSANPVAPSGTILTISASPTQIDLTGSSVITVIGRRPNGNALASGTEIRLSTTLGSIETIVQVDGNGVARATLRADGRAGTATVTATTSGSTGGGSGDEEGAGSSGTATVSVDVEIGRPVGAISLQSTPASVPESGATVSLLALVRDQDGEPLGGISVNFLAEIGALESGGAFIRTDADGQARDSLELTEGDLNSISGDSFTVTAEAAGGGSGDGGLIQSDDAVVSILRRPEASFTFNRNDLTVVFQDTSTGNPTSWLWTFGDETASVPQQNPTHRYDAAGSYNVTLTVRNSAGSNSVSQVVTVETN